jgi:hypothetical protein
MKKSGYRDRCPALSGCFAGTASCGSAMVWLVYGGSLSLACATTPMPAQRQWVTYAWVGP